MSYVPSNFLILPLIKGFIFQFLKSVFAFLISMFLSSVIAIAENYEIINLNCDSFKLASFLEYTDHNVFLAFSVIISLYSIFRVKLQKKYRNYTGR